MTNIVKCYKHFFGYFNALKTHCDKLNHKGIEKNWNANCGCSETLMGSVRFLDCLRLNIDKARFTQYGTYFFPHSDSEKILLLGIQKN